MFKPKLPQQEQGFTLVEVLVAILITLMFVGVAMQTMAIAAIFKARARQFAEATTWIQEHLEEVKYQAGQLTYEVAKCKANNSDAGFGDSLKQKLPNLTSTKTITGKSYTLTLNPFIAGNVADAVSSTCTNTACYELLQLTYQVRHGSEFPIATMYTEVIPNAALQCP